MWAYGRCDFDARWKRFSFLCLPCACGREFGCAGAPCRRTDPTERKEQEAAQQEMRKHGKLLIERTLSRNAAMKSSIREVWVFRVPSVRHARQARLHS